MDRCSFIIIDRKPSTIHTLSIWQFIENSVAPKKNEVMGILKFECLDVGNRNHHVWIPSILLVLGLDVAKRPWDRKSPWQHPMRTHHVRTLDPDAAKRRNFSHGFGLVDFASVLLDSHLLKVVVRTVVSRKRINLVSSLGTHDCAWIADVCDIDHIINYQASDGTRTTFVEII